MTNNTCPKCQSHNWDYACVGVPHAILCVDCGHLYPDWVKYFPKYPATPLTDKEVKQYNKDKVQSLGDAMM